MTTHSDTIFALSSAPGRAALSIIRISGHRALWVVEKLTRKETKKFEHRTSIPLDIYNNNNTLIDKAVLSFYLSPNSYTGEDLVEITTHGNPIIVDNVFKALINLGLRFANPGEFTSRAHSNKKIDLVQAESILSTINAKSQAGVQTSLLGVAGKLSNKLKDTKNLLVLSLSELEYELDISETDNRDAVIKKATKNIKKTIGEIENLIESHDKASILTDGAKIVITGAPNVGKSTLLNALLDNERAIVTSTPGTTRDTIESLTYFSNYPVLLVDTAGIRKTNNQIEKVGINKTKKEITSSNIIYNIQSDTGTENLNTNPNKTIKIFNKSDLMNEKEKKNLLKSNPNCVVISAKNKWGIDKLKTKTIKLLNAKTNSNEPFFLSSKRQQAALKRSKKHLKKALKKESLVELEIIAQNLRFALNEFDWVLGKTTTDEILNSVFSDFCVGK